MHNSSFIYAVDEGSVELATPYLLSPIVLRPVAWEAIREAGRDMAPAGPYMSTLSLDIVLMWK